VPALLAQHQEGVVRGRPDLPVIGHPQPEHLLPPTVALGHHSPPHEVQLRVHRVDGIPRLYLCNRLEVVVQQHQSVRSQTPQIPVHPLHGGVPVRHRPLGHQVVHVLRPVLNGRVPTASSLLHDDLHDGAMQGVRGVDGSRTPLHVVNVGPPLHDDQRPLELSHVLRVDPEVRLQGDVHLHPLRHVDEGAPGPHRGVQGRELVVLGRDHRAEVLTERDPGTSSPRCPCPRR
jgi:hypothetical protein